MTIPTARIEDPVINSSNNYREMVKLFLPCQASACNERIKIRWLSVKPAYVVLCADQIKMSGYSSSCSPRFGYRLQNEIVHRKMPKYGDIMVPTMLVRKSLRVVCRLKMLSRLVER
jgi:hypothetical protein